MKTISKVKRQPSEWEKIIAKEATDKHLISKIYKQLLQFNSRKINGPNQKISQRTKQTFLPRDIQVANKYTKRCSTSLIIREMQIKTTMWYRFMIEWLLSKSLQTINAGESAGKSVRDSYIVGGNAN